MKILICAAVAALALPAAASANSHIESALPKCSATVTDSCDQGANNPKAMTADQAEASGGVGDRHVGTASSKASLTAAKKPIRRKVKTITTETSVMTPAQ